MQSTTKSTVLTVVLTAFISYSSTAELEDCRENGSQCKEFLKSSLCGRFVWCYKREKEGQLSNLCTFSSTQYQMYGMQDYKAPIPNPKKCKPLTDKDHDCYKLCQQLKDTVYLFAGFFNVCLQECVPYICTSNKNKGMPKSYCGCGQVANGDVLQGKDVNVGDKC